MRRLVIGFVGFVIAFVTSYGAKAEEAAAKITPIQISIWNPVQLAPEDRDVWGFRLNLLYGKNRDVFGLDLGLVNSSRSFQGIQVGFANTGLGMSLPPFSLSYVYFTSSGIQIGSLNYFSGDFDGIQVAGIVNTAHRVRGIQISCFGNKADDMNGLQIGVFNHAKTMTGVQIGLINTITDSPVSFLPIVNAHF